jgi:hypothetical protein
MLEKLEESTRIYNFDETYELRTAWSGHLILEDDYKPSRSWWRSNGTVFMSIASVMESDEDGNLKLNEDGYPKVVQNENWVRNRHIYVLLHEIGHHIGAPDHYCYNEGAPNWCGNENCFTHSGFGDEPKCVMTEWTDDFDKIESVDWHGLFCRECSGRDGTIRTYLREDWRN